MRSHLPVSTLLALFLPVAACSCSSDSNGLDNADLSADPVEEITVFGLTIAPISAGEVAVPVAEKLWDQISGDNDYKAWALLDATSEKQESKTPHGDFATVHYSGSTPDAASPGDILVKELWVGEEGKPQALTVMLKLENFDPENANWFYAKYLLDGSLDTTPAGVPLAGAMEPSPGRACRGCHRSAPGRDFQWL